MAANSLRPQIVQVMAAHRERPLTTTEVYQYVAAWPPGRLGRGRFRPEGEARPEPGQ